MHQRRRRLQPGIQHHIAAEVINFSPVAGGGVAQHRQNRIAGGRQYVAALVLLFQPQFQRLRGHQHLDPHHVFDVLDDLAFSEGAAEAGVAALKNNCPVYCDVEMVKAGIIERNLPGASRLVCTLNDPRAGYYGKAAKNTRTASAVDFWDELDGSICVIGNAPTALFRLLERIDEGGGTPALIAGLPVGFVGAVESKAELAANPRGAQFITVHGRRGGSAMASSVVNALAYLATGKS